MKHLPLIGVLLLSACSPTAPAPAKDVAAAPAAVDVAATQAEVRTFIETYNGYYGSNDLDRYFASFDSGLTQWWPSGRVDLATYEKSWREGVAKGYGTAKAVVSDLQIQVGPSGDTAVATYLLEVTPRVPAGKTATVERNQETDVLFKQAGQWKIVHVNYGPAAPPKK